MMSPSTYFTPFCDTAPSSEPVSVNALLHRLVALEAFTGVRVEAPFETVVPADAGQLEQALINLIKNGIEAAENGAAGVDITVSRARDAALIDIRDTGPGVANPDNLFVPFFTTKKGTGAGLGLWVVKQLAEKYHGRITIRTSQAASRHGTAVSIFLPRQPE